jgi:hypothetical protein
MPLGALGCGIAAGAVAFWLATTDTSFVSRAAGAGLVYIGLLLLSRTVSLPLLWRLGNDILAGGSNRA